MTLLSWPARNPNAGGLGTWLAQCQPICLGIAELSKDGRAAYAVRAPQRSHIQHVVSQANK